MKMKVVIVGGVAGGATAAARLRRLDEQMEIIMVERSDYISYANCGLPYYIGGSIEDEKALTLQTPESFYHRFRIDVRTHQEVTKINALEKTVTIQNLENHTTYVESYDKLILSPGAKAILPPIDGVTHDNVFTLRTVEDTFKIHDYIQNHEVKKAVVVGAGFIGLEMAENLKEKGMDVTVVQLLDQIMTPLDKDMAAIVQNYLKHQGIELLLETSLTKIIKKDEDTWAVLDNHKEIACDMILMAVGVQPDSQLAKTAGIALGIKGAIKVNAHMQTNIEDIYAVGDAVEVKHFITQKDTLISLAGPANKQGRIAADHICGINSRYKGSQGSSILKLFDMQIAATGLNEKEAQTADIDYDYAIITSASHATYYPEAKNMYLKVLFDKADGTILGGQIVGYDGVDKRIDVLATAIRAKMTAYDLTELDLAYAPPFSSAKDPMNMIGFVIENILTDKVKQIHWSDVKDDEKAIILDTRTQLEYQRGHFPNALHIPLDELRERLIDLDQDKEIQVYCQSGLRSYLACRILSQHGYVCKNIAGGYGIYQQIEENKVMQSTGMRPCGIDEK
ncbi:CoA-disulfide reductase [Beduini massiliensis]|uniref:CoA-disulfide reductase n=1 Tax=Beduini massiliensis TaxID=1585974 RepID=UPI000AC746AA|nr:CoA-disulfide reductase [Beduini massiliensis]